jgi:hypothetical protein
MAPEVLHRVCHGSPTPQPWQKNLLTIRPAVLPSYTRHKVRHCDYPAIIPTPSASVRGTLVTGLNDGDIWRLDIFEGSEYIRKKVKVKVLEKAGNDHGVGNVTGEEVEAETYVWTADRSGLEEGEWDFGVFVKEKMGRWVGANAEDEGLQGRKKSHYILGLFSILAAALLEVSGLSLLGGVEFGDHVVCCLLWML